MTTPDLLVLALYLLAVTAFGLIAAGRQRNADDYFLGARALPWPAIAFSTVATETSALTVISVPATAYTGDLWMMQLVLGYVIGRLLVAALILPIHFRRGATTTYAFLEERFGLTARRFASAIFLVTRALADSVRVFAASIPVALLSGLPYWQSILITGVVTLIYTYYGGLRAVVWVDVVQLTLYLLGGALAVALLGGSVEGGWTTIAERLPAAKTQLLHLSGGFDDARWWLTGLVGGAFLSMASHGTDHLIVQRLMAAHDLTAARKALITDALLVVLQFALFLAIGAGLFIHFGGREFATPDEVFPTFVIEQFPAGLAGLMIAGIIAAAMSTLSSSLNALASSTTLDLYAPLSGRSEDSDHLMRVGRVFTLLWAIALVGGAMLFRFAAQDTPVVVIALQIASFTYGGLLGGFLLGVLSRRARERDAVIGIGSAVVGMAILWASQQFGAIPTIVNTLWFSLIGSVITVGVGLLSSRSGAGPDLAPSGARDDLNGGRTNGR